MWLLEKIHEEKPRYIRDQLSQIRSAIKGMSPEVINQALEFCIKNRLYSSVDFKDAICHYSKGAKVLDIKTDVRIAPLSLESIEKINIKPEVRSISEYTQILSRSSEENEVDGG